MQQGSIIRGTRKRGPDVWQFRWADRKPNGKRIYRRRVIGTVCQFPDPEFARKAVTGLVREINQKSGHLFSVTVSVRELCDHFTQRELAKENMWRSHSTKRAYKGYLDRWVIPRWGEVLLPDVRAMDVESWLRSLTLAKGSCAKIRNLLSVLFNHACRYELFDGIQFAWFVKGPSGEPPHAC